jgi:hypothetical protein
MARTSSVSHTSRSWHGEGERRRHMKNPEAATPRMRQHRLAEKPCPARSAMTGYLAIGRTPPSNSVAACLTNASSVSNSRMRRLAAASSPRSLVDSPGLSPRSMRSQGLGKMLVCLVGDGRVSGRLG